MHERGELDADPDALALALLDSIQGGLLLAQLRRDPPPVAVAMDTVIDQIASRLRA